MPKHYKKENPSPKKIDCISCQTCIKKNLCSGYIPDEECYLGKKTSTMDEKIAEREETARFRRRMARLYNL